MTYEQRYGTITKSGNKVWCRREKKYYNLEECEECNSCATAIRVRGILIPRRARARAKVKQ